MKNGSTSKKYSIQINIELLCEPQKKHENRSKIMCAIEFELIGFSVLNKNVRNEYRGTDGSCIVHSSCAMKNTNKLCHSFSHTNSQSVQFIILSHTSFYDKYQGSTKSICDVDVRIGIVKKKIRAKNLICIAYIL